METAGLPDNAPQLSELIVKVKKIPQCLLPKTGQLM